MIDPLLNPPKLVINAALTGIVPTKDENPNLPITPAEIIADSKRCRDAGASIVHVHARDKKGNPAWQPEIYGEIVSGIRASCPDLIVCVTTSGRVFSKLEERSASLLSHPDMASLTPGSMNFAKEASVTEPTMVRELAECMLNHEPKRVVPELELFDLGMASYVNYLIGKGHLVPPFYFNILLGSLGTLSADPHHLVMMIRDLPNGAIWSAAGIGRYQKFVTNLAIAMGGHVRVGLEDNLFSDLEKKKPASNPELVENVVRVAKALGREIASPSESRQLIWGVTKSPSGR